MKRVSARPSTLVRLTRSVLPPVVLCLLYCLLTIADGATTILGLRYGIQEHLPLARWLLSVGGWPLFVIEHGAAGMLAIFLTDWGWSRYDKPTNRDAAMRALILVALLLCCTALALYVTLNIQALRAMLVIR